MPTLSYYTLTYESNGGTQYDSETYSGGTAVSLDKIPPGRADFTGWFADQALTTPVTQVVMDASKTVYAGWSPVVQGTPSPMRATAALNTTARPIPAAPPSLWTKSPPGKAMTSPAGFADRP